MTRRCTPGAPFGAHLLDLREPDIEELLTRSRSLGGSAGEEPGGEAQDGDPGVTRTRHGRHRKAGRTGVASERHTGYKRTGGKDQPWIGTVWSQHA